MFESGVELAAWDENTADGFSLFSTFTVYMSVYAVFHPAAQNEGVKMCFFFAFCLCLVSRTQSPFLFMCLFVLSYGSARQVSCYK